ncbi:beta-N-acetylhexosaminidase [Sphingobacterium yanglingense]|uniref:beta-N-acetylhexosaminidase n=1 Tax=Sphingobacterium yanglingense TaxID=1437280 RepID=A0A4R6WEK9_9SPHI|nr:family 20 glycosylhydrolase [Sphingobacterium yanglingense]TDQ75896.1 hexosaminidase [Sphingobacterium yanglingense]
MRYIVLFGALLGALTAQHALAQASSIADQVQVKWVPDINYNGKDQLDLTLIVKNTSNNYLDLSKWDLWFNAMYPVVDKTTAQYSFSDQRGNLFKLQFAESNLAPNDSLVMVYTTKYAISNLSTMPNGFYFQSRTDKSIYYPVRNVSYTPITTTAEIQNGFNESLFERNARLNKKAALPLIFPTPSTMKMGNGSYTILSQLDYFVSNEFDVKLDVLGNIPAIRNLQLSPTKEESAQLVIKRVEGLKNEAYRLSVGKEGIRIESSSDAGVQYALQSLVSMLSPDMYFAKAVLKLPFVQVEDEPRYAYRGFMMDIARNFKDKTTIFKYLDLMARYKLNVFHFHFIDDEGWRIEIPSLPELTAVGAVRSPLFSNGRSLEPAYGSGGNSVSGKFLTRTDFIEILKYAHDRNIVVIPEIETPGHARAAIKAMHARYERLMAAGEREEAEKYLLYDLEDRSEYNSVQNFGDNVINPALPSTYAFLEKVIDEFIAMYKEANIPFKKISIGGDEVPNGVWTKSPKIDALMQREGMKSPHEVWPYYIERVNAICLAKGLDMAGWEEIGMVNKGQGMVVNPELRNKSNIQVDVWNNVIGGGQEDLAYRLANAGYQTVLISASNMYFDMMWNTNFTEPGLKWATYADLFHSYSLLPEDYFANIDTYYSGKKLGKKGFSQRVRLTEKGKANFLGIKGGLWAETVLNEEQMDYLVFPRFFALAERAWSDKRPYENEAKFDLKLLENDYAKFIIKVGTDELPKIAEQVKFRLPGVGLKEIKGKVFANVEYPGFSIYYTSDGSLPTLNSERYEANTPVFYRAGQVLAFAVVDTEGRLGQVSYFKK